MNRASPLAGPGGLFTFLVIMWFAVGGVTLAWLTAPSADNSGLRALVTRLANGRAGD